MNGKIVKLMANDVYGNSSDRMVSVFAVFNHKKYMNKYIIFTYTDEININKIYYGSVHIKDDTLVAFTINDTVLPYIDTFAQQYLSDGVDVNEYEIIDISGIKKIQVVSAMNREFSQVKELDNKAIKKEVIDQGEVKTGKGGLTFLLVLFMLLLGGAAYLYFNPGLLQVELKELTCERELYHEELEMKYTKDIDVRFDKDDHPLKLNVTEIYIFPSAIKYLEFKESDKLNEYFKTVGEYKYLDDLNQLKIFYTEQTIISDYDELYSYLKSEGYTCQEGTYYE